MEAEEVPNSDVSGSLDAEAGSVPPNREARSELPELPFCEASDWNIAKAAFSSKALSDSALNDAVSVEGDDADAPLVESACAVDFAWDL